MEEMLTGVSSIFSLPLCTAMSKEQGQVVASHLPWKSTDGGPEGTEKVMTTLQGRTVEALQYRTRNDASVYMPSDCDYSCCCSLAAQWRSLARSPCNQE